ncbi:hypothetical protein B0H14DRAFT_3495079 [Mycena olivaceomarginata]|nr:hypothetical protein B0H14DRAFT_3495079 [Mycena olivaceomarginata]
MPSTSALTLLFLAFFAIFVASAPLATPLPRDVYSPRVLYPRNDTVWHVGKTYTVTWNVTDAPKSITNSKGMIILVQNHRMIDLNSPLAEGFSILLSKFNITIPHTVKPGTYQLLLMGDSGNVGDEFTIAK